MAHGIIPDEYRWRCFFHMTDIGNLQSILVNGLLCTNEMKRRGIVHNDIANLVIQERRSLMDVPCGNGGNVHDYVPFYFASVNPMLLSLVKSKNFDQEDIVFLCLKIDKLISLDAIFTDASANTVIPPQFFDNAEKLSQLSWDLIDDRRWGSESDETRHRKMAEVLIHKKVQPQDIEAIVVSNEQHKKIVEQWLKEAGLSIRVCYECYGVYDAKTCYFYYKKWMVTDQRQQRESLVTGPKALRKKYKRLLENIKHSRELNSPNSYRYHTITEMLNAIHLDFSSINELSGIEGLSTSNPYHHMTVSDHTLDVVEKVKETQYYQQTDVRTKDILELAAYLHDIGKGPKSKWRDEIQPPYPDHPADAIPMLARIFTKDLEEISEDEIRIISLIVVYHDIIGEYLSKGRRIDEFLPLIVCEKDYDMLACLSEADMKSIDYLWWVEYKAKERELKTRFIPHE